MRILIINTDYPAFLSHLYASRPNLETAPYDEQMVARNESLFGVADFYSRNLRALGHEAWDVHANNEIMQRAWAQEHGLNTPSNSGVPATYVLSKARPLASIPLLTPVKSLMRPVIRRLNAQTRLLPILEAQIRHYRPTVVLNQAMEEIPDEFLCAMRPYVELMVGQVASQLSAQKRFRSYDLVISSLPNLVNYFRKEGLPAELNRLAFEASVLERCAKRERIIDISFVGSFSAIHANRARLLGSVADHVDLDVWGNGLESLPLDSAIRRRHHGPAWGAAMYDVLARSRLTLNNHEQIANNYANNMRLFEATGMGALLVTDSKANLHEMFDAGKDIVVYRSTEECIEILRHYRDHESERETIARSGQQRTLRDHTYEVRMQQLGEIFSRYLHSKARGKAKGG